MNKISQIRKDIQLTGEASLDINDYNQLQMEWITRAKIEGIVEVSKLEELIAEECFSVPTHEFESTVVICVHDLRQLMRDEQYHWEAVDEPKND